MSVGYAMRRKSVKAELTLEDRGEASRGERSGEALTAVNETDTRGSRDMTNVTDRLNSFNRRMRTRMSGGVGGDGPG